MLRRSFFPIILLLCLFLVLAALAVPAFAQDQLVTNTPIATVQATVNGTPVQATLAAPTASPILTPDNAISVSTLIYGLIIAILGGGTVGAVVNRFGGNKVNQDAMEKLYQSQSPAAQERERQFYEGLREVTLRVLDYVDKVTDGQPNAPVAQLAAVEGPALAKQSDLDELSRKLDVLKRHYPIPQEMATIKPSDSAQ